MLTLESRTIVGELADRTPPADRAGEAETRPRCLLSIGLVKFIPIVVALPCAPDGSVRSSTKFGAEAMLGCVFADVEVASCKCGIASPVRCAANHRKHLTGRACYSTALSAISRLCGLSPYLGMGAGAGVAPAVSASAACLAQRSIAGVEAPQPFERASPPFLLPASA